MPNDPNTPDSDTAERLYTATEVEQIASHREQRARAAAPARQTPRAAAPPAAPNSTAAMLDQLVALKIAEALGGQTATAQRNAQPVSDRGSPPPVAIALEDQNVLNMSPSDREHLLKQKGNRWFTDKITADVRGHAFKIR